ncbi:MAG: hypothetical protein ACYDG3_09960, partial [Bacillati bacterium]
MKVYIAGHMPKSEERDWRMEDIVSRLASYEIEFLIPSDTSNAILKTVKHGATATKDEMFLNECDIAVVNLDLDMGRCL